MQGRGVFTDQEMTKDILKPVFPGQVIIVFKHGEQKAFAESSWTQKKKKISSILYHGDTVCPVAVKQPFRYDLIKIAHTVRKSHVNPCLPASGGLFCLKNS